MLSNQIKVGGIYRDVQLDARVKVTKKAGEGRWRVRYLDPPYIASSKVLYSRSLSPWQHPGELAELEALGLLEDEPSLAIQGQLTRLGARFSERMRELDGRHPVTVKDIELSLSNSDVGSVRLDLPEPVARTLLEALGGDLAAVDVLAPPPR